MNELITLKITSAIAISGRLHKAGAIVDVDESVAKRFLERGKAVLATEADAPAAVPVEPVPAIEPVPEPAPKATKPAKESKAAKESEKITEPQDEKNDN